ncbi:D-alanyl-D-alanine carboxypeptidase family protein [Tepidibacillus marianensis]|uniref:D-alanyl-D-alanine carboxypeptidase family protein n=1 Tax=Tepidibacillus marianensis TaxID=3131995 RepID=UPI0030D557E1
MKRFYKFFTIFIALALIFPLFGLRNSVSAAQTNLDIQAKSAILVDAISGKILYAQNPDIPLPPASMTKMMTEYLVEEAISKGKLKWDDVVTASDYAHFLGKGDGSKVGLAVGEQHSVEELTYAMTVGSANDATVALAEHLAGSETNFVQMMNEKAKALGMTSTHFATATGYPKKDLGKYAPASEGESMMTARDAATLAWHLIHDYPDSLEFNKTAKYTFMQGQNERILKNYNFMIPGLIYANLVQGVDGLKTGHTSAAGYNFTSTAVQNGMRLISVVQGTNSEKERFFQTQKLLNYGFASFELVDLMKANESLKGSEMTSIVNGKDKQVQGVTKDTFSVVVKKGEKDLYKPVTVYNKEIQAPIKSGQKIGHVTFEYKGKDKYDYLNNVTKMRGNMDLIAKNDVEKASGFRLFFRKIFSVIGGIFTGIVHAIKGLF